MSIPMKGRATPTGSEPQDQGRRQVSALSGDGGLLLPHAPLVSIIINNYNYGRFLPDAIASALRQTYDRVEVLVVDDGSTDHSREIVASYGDQIIPILKENGGQASALNAGFARSRGDIIIFLDADDLLLPDIASQVVDAVRSNPAAVRAQYRMEVVDALGQPTGVLKPPRHVAIPSGNLQRHVLTFPADLPWLPTSGNAFSARVLRQIFPMPEPNFRILADFYLSHLTPLFGPVISIDRVGAYYRVHGSNNYEYSGSDLNLQHVRQTTIHWRETHACIERIAASSALSYPWKASRVLSVAYLANRMISFKLDPGKHPIKGDTGWKLCFSGVIASLQRFDVAFPIRCLFILWFLAIACVPSPAARWLAVKFLFPEKRGHFNSFLRLRQGHRSQVTGYRDGA